MPRTQVPGEQVLDHDIQRDDLDVSTAGQAVITKVIAGIGIEIASTGTDDGTGDVTVKATLLSSYSGSLTSKIVGPSETIVFLEHDGVLHSEAGFYITEASKLRSMVINVEEADPMSTYELILYANPSGTPSEIHHIELPDDNKFAYENALSIDLPVGEYGLALKKITPTLEPYDTFIHSLGPEAYYRMDEQPTPPLFTNTFYELAELATTGAWVTTTLPGVPANARVLMAMSCGKSDGGRTGGIRAVGSAITRSFFFHGPKAADPAKNYALFTTNADASSQVQLYAENAGEVRFIILGYWESGTYVETNTEFTASGSGSWVTMDLSSAGVGSGDIVELAVANYEKDIPNVMGVRAVGSSIERKFEIDNGNGIGTSASHSVITAKANASGQVEVWTDDAITTLFRLLGYWSTPPDCDYIEDFTSIGTPTSNDVWENTDVTGTLPTNVIADIYIENTSTDGEHTLVGAREPAQPAGDIIAKRDGELNPWLRYYGPTGFGELTTTAASDDMRAMRSAASRDSWKSVTVGVGELGGIWLLLENSSVWSATQVGTTTETYWWLGDVAWSTDGSDTAVICYRNGTNLELRTWDGTTLSVQTVITSDVAPSEVNVENDPNSDRFIITCTRTDNTLKAWSYDLSTGVLVGPEDIATLSADEAVDIMFTPSSGVCYIVYGKAGSTNLHYKTWDSGTYSSEGTITSPVAKAPYFVALAAREGTDELAVAVTTVVSGTAACWAGRFNGTSWGNTVTLANDLPTGLNYPAAGVEFEQSSGRLVAVYKNEGSNIIAYRTWSSGSGWSGELLGPDLGQSQRTIRVWHTNNSTDKIIFVALLANTRIATATWNGTSWGPALDVLGGNSGETKNQPFTFHHHFTESGVFVNRLFYGSDDQQGDWTLSNLLTPVNQYNEIQLYEGTNIGAFDFKSLGYWEPTAAVQIFDDTINNHDGTYENGPLLNQTGRIAGSTAVHFDGVNDYASVGTWDVTGTGISLKAWVKLDTLPGVGNVDRIIYKGDASNPLWSLEINNNYPQFVFKASSATYTLSATSTILTTGTWYLIVATYDETTQDYVLYVDGVDVASANTGVGGATLDTTSDPIYLGARTPSLGFLDGILDEVVIFPDALTAGEVDDIWDHRDEILNPDSQFAKAWAEVRVTLDV